MHDMDDMDGLDGANKEEVARLEDVRQTHREDVQNAEVEGKKLDKRVLLTERGNHRDLEARPQGE